MARCVPSIRGPPDAIRLGSIADLLALGCPNRLRGGPGFLRPSASYRPVSSPLVVPAIFASFEDLEAKVSLLGTDHHLVAGIQGAREDHARQLVVHPALDGAPQGPGSELGIEALLGYQPDRPLGELDLDVLGPKASGGPVEEQTRYLAYLLFVQRAEDDDLVYAVDELGPEMMPHDLHHVLFELLEGLVLSGVGLDPLGSHVRGHNNYRVLEVHGSPLRVGKPAVVEDLQEDVEDVRMGFLDLIQEQDRVRTAPHALGELSSLLVAHVARRSPHKPGDGVALLELTHVNAHHRRLVPEERLG